MKKLFSVPLLAGACVFALSQTAIVMAESSNTYNKPGQDGKYGQKSWPKSGEGKQYYYKGEQKGKGDRQGINNDDHFPGKGDQKGHDKAHFSGKGWQKGEQKGYAGKYGQDGKAAQKYSAGKGDQKGPPPVR